MKKIKLTEIDFDKKKIANVNFADSDVEIMFDDGTKVYIEGSDEFPFDYEYLKEDGGRFQIETTK